MIWIVVVVIIILGVFISCLLGINKSREINDETYTYYMKVLEQGIYKDKFFVYKHRCAGPRGIYLICREYERYENPEMDIIECFRLEDSPILLLGSKGWVSEGKFQQEIKAVVEEILQKKEDDKRIHRVHEEAAKKRREEFVKDKLENYEIA